MYKTKSKESLNCTEGSEKENVRPYPIRQSILQKNREKTGVKDVLEFVLEMKWRWAGHIGSMSDNRWTYKCTFWDLQTPRRPGRPRAEWETDIVKYDGPNWRERSHDRQLWKVMAEGYIQQWTNIA